MFKSPVVSLSISTAMVVTSVVQPALAGELPSGGNVIAGDASITLPSADNLMVTQRSDKAIVNWNSFSIGKGNSVTFNNGNGATLNRVTGGDVSKIYGKLSASGSVFLINQNGVLIGESGVIETGGSFVASTLDVTDENFLNGGDLTFSGTADSSVINLGQVSSLGGDVALISRTVVNEGKLTAQQGTVGLAAGREILLRDAALDDGKFLVKVGGASDSVTEKGMIEAAVAELKTNGGNIYALAGNDGGAINATGFSKSGGRVFLGAGGGKVTVAKTIRSKRKNGATTNGGEIFINADLVEISGLLDASGVSGAGGNIDIGGDSNIELTNALLNASGALSGGQVRVGGELMGGRDLSEDEVQNVARLSVDSTSRIDVSSSQGAGGTAVLWSEERTDFAGHINAFGSQKDVNGGFAEVSSYGTLDFTGTVDTGGGTLLLDPTDIEIGLVDNNIANSFISLSDLASALFSNDVVITTHDDARSDPGHIYWTSDYTYDYSNDLSLLASGDIRFSGALQNQNETGGAINLVAGWDGSSGLTGTVTGGLQTNLTFDNAVFANADLSTQTIFGQSYDGGSNFGSVIIGDGNQSSGIAVGSRSGETNVYAYDLEIQGGNASGAYSQLGFQATDNGGSYEITGDIAVRAAGGITATGGSRFRTYAQLGHVGSDTSQGTREATVDADISIEATGNLEFAASTFAESYVQLGHGGMYAYGDFSGNLTISSANNLSFSGNTATYSYALLGHGTQLGVGDKSGDITIGTVNDLTFTAGSGGGAFAQLGLGGRASVGDHSGTITINSANDLTFKGNGWAAFAQLGHGGVASDGTSNSGDITIASANDLSFEGGASDNSFAQLGHGGGFSEIDSTGNITIASAANLSLVGGSGASSYAQLGHGAASFGGSSQEAGLVQGDISVTLTGEATIEDGTDPATNYTYGWLGHATANADDVSNADVFVQAAAFDRVSASNIASGGLSIFSTDMIENGLSGGNVTLIATDSSLSLEAASGAVSSDQTYSSSNGLSLLAAYDMNFADVGLQNNNDTGGDFNLVAGYNVNQTAWTPSADFDADAFNNQSLGSQALFGLNNGTVIVGDSSQSDEIRVGTRNGVNRAYGYDVNVLGGNGGYAAIFGYVLDGTDSASGSFVVRAENDVLVDAGVEGAYAMIGHRANAASGGLSGDVQIEAVNDVSVLAGGIGSFAQIGHGGGGFSNESSSGDVSGDISIIAGRNVAVEGGTSNFAYGRIGHLGTQAAFADGTIGDVSGDITIDADGNLAIAGGSDGYTDAQIGHGGADAGANFGNIDSITGNIDVTVGGDADLTGGSDYAAYAQLGHAGYNYAQDDGSGGTVSGTVSLNTGGAIALAAGTGDYSYSQVGHGGQEAGSDGGSIGNLIGNVTVEGTSGVTLSGGSYKAYAQIGHGGSEAGEDFGVIGEISGDVHVSSEGDVTADGGDGEQAFAQLGHGGANFVQESGISGPVDGDVTLIAGGVVEFRAGTGDYSYTQVGHGGQEAGSDGGIINSMTGNIVVDATSGITLSGGTYKAYAQFGHGGSEAGEDGGLLGPVSGFISVATDGDVTANGGSDEQAYAQLGHGGSNSNSDNTGVITLEAGGNVQLVGGTGNSSYAQLGHGAAEFGFSGQTSGAQQGDITVTAVGEVSIEDGAGDYSFAWLGHATSGTNSISNADVTATASGFDKDAGVALVSGSDGTISDAILDNALGGGNVWIKATDTGLALGGTVSQSNANDFTIIAANDITFLSGLAYQNSGSGNLIFAAGDDFHNDSGSLTPLGVGSGRWLIYSTRPDNNRDDIEITNRDFLRYSTSFDESNPVPADFASGNGLIYSVTPLVNVVAEDQTIFYGEGIDTNAFAPLFLTVNGVNVDANEFDIDLNAVTGAVQIAQSVPIDGAGNAEAGFWTDGIDATGSFAASTWYGVGITTEGADLTVLPTSVDPDVVDAANFAGTCRYDVLKHVAPTTERDKTETLYEFDPTAQCYNMRQVLPISKICSVDGTCFDVSSLFPPSRNVN
ncbi:beta strand repeat-containing protein [Roseibium sp. SCP14]|uniref:beta strand repeat-containing protein n=1 Tax=Roseibium sp. SCP14 TaxID=3141375 RepID=UPI00333922EF